MKMGTNEFYQVFPSGKKINFKERQKNGFKDVVAIDGNMYDSYIHQMCHCAMFENRLPYDMFLEPEMDLSGYVYACWAPL